MGDGMIRNGTTIIGIILSVIGFILFVSNINDSSTWYSESLYWAFGGCMASLSGFVILIIALIWPRTIAEKVTVECSHCDANMRIPAEYSGNARCPSCKEEFTVE